jgi:hypothetical protein
MIRVRSKKYGQNNKKMIIEMRPVEMRCNWLSGTGTEKQNDTYLVGASMILNLCVPSQYEILQFVTMSEASSVVAGV